MARSYSIWIVTPPGYLHSRCFEEVALSLREAFAALGFDAPIVTDPAQASGTVVTLGANLLPSMAGPVPDNLILYNLEQIQQNSIWINAPYIELLKRHSVWDYSERNIAALEGFGVDNVALCGIGYMPSLTRITPAPRKDIDVLFVGSTNDRRMNALNAIAAQGKHVSAAFNSYGSERDALIARAKILINLHYYEAQVFEIVRVSYLLANRCCVVSETGHDAKLEASLAGGVAFAPYAKLTETCLRLLSDESERERIARAGFETFSAMSQVPMLKRALGSLPL